MEMVVKTRGFKELDRVLSEQLPKATARNVLRRIAKNALEPLAVKASAKAPDLTGRLAFSIAVSEDRTRRARTGFNKNRGVQMAMGPASGVGATYYASAVEFGTIDTPAQPFMRPVWSTGAMKMLDYVQDNLWREVEKAVGRVNTKRAKA